VATRVTERLDRTGFAEVIPVVDGRDVELRGSVESASEARRAERVVSMVRGVRVVRTNILVAGENGAGGGDS
jgi:osmotically-inducible protein OsmY